MTDREWLNAVARRIQIDLGPLACSEIDDVPALAASAAGMVPAPRTHAESLVLRSLFAEAAAKCGTAIHRRAHTGTSIERCTFTSASFLESFLTMATDDPRQDFARWAAAFVQAFRARHPGSVADRAAGILRTRYTEPWTALTLADAVATTCTTLSRHFVRRYGMPVHAYHRLARVVAALEQMAHGNVEAIAIEVGYRSRKNLYTALQHTAALSPAAFRSLPGATARELVERLRDQLSGARRM